MGNDYYRAALFFVHFFKHVNEVLKAPQINAGFRFVKNGNVRTAYHNGGNLNTFELAARKTCVDFAMNIILRT